MSGKTNSYQRMCKPPFRITMAYLNVPFIPFFSLKILCFTSKWASNWVSLFLFISCIFRLGIWSEMFCMSNTEKGQAIKNKEWIDGDIQGSGVPFWAWSSINCFWHCSAVYFSKGLLNYGGLVNEKLHHAAAQLHTIPEQWRWTKFPVFFFFLRRVNGS